MISFLFHLQNIRKIIKCFRPKDHSKKTFKDTILMIGLPGMANVGKIALDYLVSELNADLFATLNSDRGPAFSLISEDNLIVLPNIDIYHKKIEKKDFFFIVGDYQPISDSQSFWRLPKWSFTNA